LQKTSNLNKEKVFIKKEDEKILVVPRNKILPDGSFTGIKKVSFGDYEKLIDKNKQFLWRSQVEENSNFKQIIPYLIFSFNNKLFLMKRKNSANETRLKNKYSFGIGGHIRQDDIGNRTIFDWAKREFNEEVLYKGSLKITPVGLLNDDGNEVGKVHIGFVFLLVGDNGNIQVKSELQEGCLLSVHQCQPFYTQMESWSQFVFNHLKDYF